MSRLVIDARLAGHSGIGTYLCELLPRVLPALAPWQPRVLVAPMQREMMQSRLPGTTLDTWSVTPLSIADLVATPPDLSGDDVLWTPHFNVPLRSRGPLVVTLHDLLPLTAPALAGRYRGMPVRAWLRAIRARARSVLCVSQFTRAEAMRLGRIPASRTRVTHLGVDAAWFRQGDNGTPPPGAPRTIVCVGLMKPHKNLARLLRAFAHLRERIPHRLVLVARHHGVRHVDREALDLALAMPERVELVESLPFAELVRRVAHAEFAAQPSLHEGFGLPALEAMAAGVPVLAGHAGALPEVCGDAAEYCDPESERDIERALLLLATDARLRHRLAAEGRKRARSFSWDACARITVDALRASLAEPMHGRAQPGPAS